MANAKLRKSGPLSRAFVKGLSIVLPAIITIALFAWVWDILRVNVVELLIRGMDSISVFADRPLDAGEIDHLRATSPHKLRLYEQWVLDGKPEGADRVLLSDLPISSRNFSPPMRKRGLLQVILDGNHWEREYDPISGRAVSFHWFEYLLATIVGLVLVVLLGFIARNFIGKRLVALLEWFVTRTPVVKAVYPHAKQLVDFFFSEKKPLEFDTVCAIEYPRERVWAIAFVTGAGIHSLQESTGQRYVTVYIPSSPAPMTGYTMFVPVDEVIRLDISVEDAMKLVISGGVLSPASEQVTPISGAQFALSHKINEQVRARKTTMLTKSEVTAAQEAANKDTREVPRPNPPAEPK